MVVVTSLTTSTVALIEYKRLSDNSWVFDPADCAYDTSVTLNFTADNQARIIPFGIDSPATSSDRIVFIAGNNDDATDTYEVDSIVLTPGGSSLTATAVVIATSGGKPQPPDANARRTLSIPLTTATLMTLTEDDAYFCTITESSNTFTFTYDQDAVTAIDTSISITVGYSGICVGTQVLLFSSNTWANPKLWELTKAAALTEEFFPFAVGGTATSQSEGSKHFAALTAIDGNFAMASPYGGGAAGSESAWRMSTFDVDLI